MAACALHEAEKDVVFFVAATDCVATKEPELDGRKFSLLWIAPAPFMVVVWLDVGSFLWSTLTVTCEGRSSGLACERDMKFGADDVSPPSLLSARC